MMRSRLDPDLARRLEAATGVDAACCVTDLRAAAEAARGGPAFARALLRAKALADEKRLLALALLRRRGELCGCEVQAALDLTHATVSHHMATLVDAGLVRGERRGKYVYYTLTREAEALAP